MYNSMHQLIKQYEQFWEEWKNDPDKQVKDTNGEERVLRPSFHDFMRWLVAHQKE